MSIFELINEIDNGEVVLPAIQRDFVWEEDRIELLFDSLFRGYPVGIILLWETYQQIQYRRFIRDHVPGEVHLFDDNKNQQRIKLVLDGQQRLSSIYVALKGSFNGRRLFYDILSGRDSDDHSEVKFHFWFASDTEVAAINTEQIESRKKGQGDGAKVAYWLRLADVVGREPIAMMRMRDEIAASLVLSPEERVRMELNLQTATYALSDNSELLKTQTIDSKLPANDAKRKSAFDILEIFVRVNTQGMPLRRSDLIVSMLRLYWSEASDLLPRFIKDVNEKGNLSIDNDFVIRCMFSTAGMGTRLDIDLLRKRSNVEKIRENYKSCFDAIRSTVDFVRHDCGIDSSRLVGGLGTLVPVVHYLHSAKGHVFPKEAREDAKRAVYLFAFTKTFTQYAESRTGAFIRDYLPEPDEIEGGEAFSLEAAIRYVYWTGNYDSPDARLFGNNVELALSMIQRRTGGKVQFSSNQPEIDHIFPRSTLATQGVDPEDVQDFGNFWILPRDMNRNKSAKHPKEYLKKVDDKVLATAFIEREALDFRTYRRFIQQRRERMVEHLRQITGLSLERFAFLADAEEDAAE